MMEMVPRRLVRSCWSGPIADDEESGAEELPSLICWRMDRTDSEGPSWQYWRMEASLALRTNTPMAWREVEVAVVGA